MSDKSRYLFSLPTLSDRLWGPSSLLSNEHRKPFPRGEADSSLLELEESAWRYSSIFTHVLMTRCFFKHENTTSWLDALFNIRESLPYTFANLRAIYLIAQFSVI
jgi:hypothetical protein